MKVRIIHERTWTPNPVAVAVSMSHLVLSLPPVLIPPTKRRAVTISVALVVVVEGVMRIKFMVHQDRDGMRDWELQC